MHLSPSKGTGMHAVMFLFCLVSQFRCSLQIKKKTIAVYTSQTSFKCISLSNCIVKVDSTSFREISLTLRLSSYVFLFFFFFYVAVFFLFLFFVLFTAVIVCRWNRTVPVAYGTLSTLCRKWPLLFSSANTDCSQTRCVCFVWLRVRLEHKKKSDFICFHVLRRFRLEKTTRTEVAQMPSV